MNFTILEAASQMESPMNENMKTMTIVGHMISLCLIFNSVVTVTGIFYALSQFVRIVSILLRECKNTSWIWNDLFDSWNSGYDSFSLYELEVDVQKWTTCK